MYTSTATWCPSCKASLPQLQALRDAFAAEELEMTGVPVDPGEGPEKLDAYAAEYRPAYRLRTDLSPEQAASFSETLARTTGLDALPSTLITAADGTILLGIPGVPTISEIRSLLRRGRAGGDHLAANGPVRKQASPVPRGRVTDRQGNRMISIRPAPGRAERTRGTYRLPQGQTLS